MALSPAERDPRDVNCNLEHWELYIGFAFVRCFLEGQVTVRLCCVTYTSRPANAAQYYTTFAHMVAGTRQSSVKDRGLPYSEVVVTDVIRLTP